MGVIVQLAMNHPQIPERRGSHWGMARSQLKHGAVARDSLVEVSALLMEYAYVQVGDGITGINSNRPLEVRDGFINAALVSQELSHIIFGHKVVVGHGEGVGPKGEAIMPDSDLESGHETENRNDGHAHCRLPDNCDPV
jgi:hypothetical protein